MITLSTLHWICKSNRFNQQRDFVIFHISKTVEITFISLPDNIIIKQLLLNRDTHFIINILAIETEKLVSDIIKTVLKKRVSKVPFNLVHYFFSYEGKYTFQSNFEETYYYNLSRTVMIIALLKKREVKW